MADYQVPEWCLYVTIGLTIMNELIFVPTIIYYTLKCWNLRHDIFFIKRRPKLILLYSFCCAINPFLRPYQLYRYWYHTEPLWVKMLAYIPWSLAATIAFLRFWLTLYDFKYNEAIYLQKIRSYVKDDTSTKPSSQTHTHSDPYSFEVAMPPLPINNVATNSNSKTESVRTTTSGSISISLWIRYRSYFGTLKGSVITVSIIFMFYCIIVAYLRTVSKILCLAFHFAYFALAIGICVAAYKKISKYRDEFYIGQELKVATKPAILFMILFAMSIVIEPIRPPLTNIISTILTFVATSAGISVFTIVSLRWGINAYHNVFCVNQNMQHEYDEMIDINECIQNREGYYLFFEYLIGEVSVESLVFITDAIYIKNKFQSKELNAISKDENFEWPKLSNKLYISSVMECETFSDAVTMINELYIKKNSLRAINISYTLRLELRSKINCIDSVNINIFDSCIEEILYLLKQSYVRFQLTTKYQTFAQAMKT